MISVATYLYHFELSVENNGIDILINLVTDAYSWINL